MVCNDYRQETSASELIRGLDWDMLSTRRKINRVNIMHKALGGHLALPVSDYLGPASRNTRRSSSGKSFIQSSTRTNCHKYSFVPRTIKDWNSLPPDIQTIEDNIIFKGALDKYNICLFISSSIEDLKSNQYRKFLLILSMPFHFTRYFVNSIIFRVPHRLLYCVFIEVDFEK